MLIPWNHETPFILKLDSVGLALTVTSTTFRELTLYAPILDIVDADGADVAEYFTTSTFDECRSSSSGSNVLISGKPSFALKHIPLSHNLWIPIAVPWIAIVSVSLVVAIVLGICGVCCCCSCCGSCGRGCCCRNSHKCRKTKKDAENQQLQPQPSQLYQPAPQTVLVAPAYAPPPNAAIAGPNGTFVQVPAGQAVMYQMPPNQPSENVTFEVDPTAVVGEGKPTPAEEDNGALGLTQKPNE
ncbi:hypothetical protein BLNAU_3833 [Blattamonas nauphoetae]|uniref:Transmembrane protein n=1 Tax=Blattamonas nauphoetae TaxID=2049346 RepID=A0ABQ9YBG8_9EUKA|nr:hypothetical protein BLNAU_3833 [Blattamonas nauphoetae]